MTNQMYWSN